MGLCSTLMSWTIEKMVSNIYRVSVEKIGTTFYQIQIGHSSNKNFKLRIIYGICWGWILGDYTNYMFIDNGCVSSIEI